MEVIVGEKFRIGRKIGAGSFGEIYLGIYIYIYSQWTCAHFIYEILLHMNEMTGTNVNSHEEVAIKLVQIALLFSSIHSYIRIFLLRNRQIAACLNYSGKARSAWFYKAEVNNATAHSFFPWNKLEISYSYTLVGIPNLHWKGKDGDYNVMIMDLLGHSLEDLFHMCGKKFSLKTVLLIADQMISRIEYIHSKNFIYRDVKPDNFLIGT